MITHAAAKTGWGVWLLLLVSGCGGSDTGSVSGRATHKDGTPAIGMRVIARSDATGKSATGITDKDGRFNLAVDELGDGVSPGDYNVVIIEGGDDLDVRRTPTIAAKYADPAKSGIAFTVKSGEEKVLEVTLDPR